MRGRSPTRGHFAACGALALALLGPSAPLGAQTGLTGGAVEGTVRNDAALALGGIVMTLVGESTGITRTVVTDQDGRYSVAALPLDTYRLRVEPPGFQP